MNINEYKKTSFQVSSDIANTKSIQQRYSITRYRNYKSNNYRIITSKIME